MGDERAPRRAQEQADRLHAGIMQGDVPQVRSAGADAVATVLSLLIIGGTVALVPLAVWVAVVVQTRWIGLLIAGFLLAVVWAVRPRRPRLPDDAVVIDHAPELRSLLDEVAAAVGTRPPRTIAVDVQINASVYDGPARDGRVLLIGAPLWLAAHGDRRLALLAHELAHFTSGDTRRNGLVGGAFTVLHGWRFLLEGDELDGGQVAGGDGSRAGLVTHLSAWLAKAVLWVVGLVPLAMGLLLERVTADSSRRAEYRADLAAAQVAGTRATVDMLRLLQRQAALDTALQRAAMARTDTLEAARAFDAAVLDPVDERLLDGPAARHDTHPPTRYRIEAVGRTRNDHTVRVPRERWEAIDAELAPALTRLERRLRDSYLGH